MNRILPFVLLVLLLAACAPAPQATPQTDSLPTAQPTRTPGGPTLTPVSFLPPDAADVQSVELLRLEGEGPGQGGPILLESETTLRVHWQQFDEELFRIYLVHSAPEQVEPQYRKVSLALSAAPSVGYTDYTFVPGEYTLLIETSAGKWLVWVESLQP